MMNHDAIVALVACLVGITFGLFVGGGAPIALTAAFERVRERSPRARLQGRSRSARGRHPYR